MRKTTLFRLAPSGKVKTNFYNFTVIFYKLFCSAQREVVNFDDTAQNVQKNVLVNLANKQKICYTVKNNLRGGYGKSKTKDKDTQTV